MLGDHAHGGWEGQSGRLELPLGSRLAEGLLTAFTDVVTYACICARPPVVDPVTAVHEYRKALRRARALVRLLAGMSSAGPYRELLGTLRDAHRDTSALRDRHVILDTLSSLGAQDEVGALVEPVVLAGRALVEPEVVLATLADGAARLAPLSELFAAALPARVDWQNLAYGLQASYRRTRKSMRHALRKAGAEPVHTWRKRNKELVYQVELFAGPGKPTIGRHKRLTRLSRDLGLVMDLVVLEQFVRDHLPARAQGALLELTAARRARLLGAAQKRAAGLFSDRPGKFARAITKQARHAHAAARKSAGRVK